MKKISQLFLQGLLAILPIIITVYIIYWLGSLAESTLGAVIKLILPYNWYTPGMGIVAGFAVTLGIGILLKAYLFRRLTELFGELLEHIPLVKTVYSSVRDIATFISTSKDDDLQKTVVLTLDNNIKVMGFITRRGISLGNEANLVAVYVPLSYQIGGFTLMVPESRLEMLDIDAESAMRFVVTAGMTDSRKK